MFAQARSISAHARPLAILALVVAMLVIPAAPGVSQSLDYRQRESLKNADYYLRQVGGNLEMVTGQVSSASAKDAPAAQANIDGLRKRLESARTHLAKLPADHAEVLPAHERAAAAQQAIDALQATLEARINQSAGAVAEESAALADDIDKLKTWGALFANPQHQFQHKPDDALAAASRLKEVEAEVAAIESRWPRLLDPHAREVDARQLKSAKSYFDRSFPNFKAYVATLRTSLPEQIRAGLAEIDKMVQTAAAERRPAYFTGGIPQRVDWLKQKVTMLEGLDPAGAKSVAAEVAGLEQRLVSAQQSLRADIISSNQPPQEKYRGPDVEQLRTLALNAWKKEHPRDEVLAVVFNTDGWSRITRWQWSEGYKAWEKVDYSKIQPKIIIRHDARLAVVYPVNIFKDHMKQDRIKVFPWQRETKPDVRSLLHVDRVK